MVSILVDSPDTTARDTWVFRPQPSAGRSIPIPLADDERASGFSIGSGHDLD